ncbi:MAG: alpha/beta hydrolase [Burkholderiaceae bacterium]
MPSIDSSGVRIHYETAGDGYPVVFLHELCADWRFWEDQMRFFARDYRCVAYNARGYPPSDVPAADADYAWERQVDDLVAVMDGLGIARAHLVGLSMGSYTALQFALRAPQRVSALVFTSGGSGSVPPGAPVQTADMQARADAVARDGMKQAAPLMAAGPTRVQLLNKDPIGGRVAMERLAEHSTEGTARTMRNFQALRPSLYGFEAELRRLDVPALLVVGDEDDPVIDLNLFLKRTMPRAGLWIVPRTGHPVNLEEPGEYNRGLATFFAQVERGGWGPRDPRAAPGGAAIRVPGIKD